MPPRFTDQSIYRTFEYRLWNYVSFDCRSNRRTIVPHDLLMCAMSRQVFSLASFTKRSSDFWNATRKGYDTSLCSSLCTSWHVPLVPHELQRPVRMAVGSRWQKCKLETSIFSMRIVMQMVSSNECPLSRQLS